MSNRNTYMYKAYCAVKYNAQSRDAVEQSRLRINLPCMYSCMCTILLCSSFPMTKTIREIMITIQLPLL